MMNQKEQFEDCILGNLIRTNTMHNFGGQMKFAKAFVDNVFRPDIFCIYPTSRKDGVFFHQNKNIHDEVISSGPIDFCCAAEASIVVTKQILKATDIGILLADAVLKRISDILIMMSSHQCINQSESIYSGYPIIAPLELVKDSNFFKYKESAILPYDGEIKGSTERIIRIDIKPVYIPFSVEVERIDKRCWKITHFFDFVHGLSYIMRGTK